MGERLQGRKVVYQRKPNPNFLGVEVELDKEAFAAHVRKTLKAAKGLNVEFTQRDVYTVHGNEEKVREYVRTVRRESEKA